VLVAQVVQNQPGGDADNALKLLERLYEAAEKAGWTNHVIQVLLLRGQLRYLLGERADGLADVSTALRLAQPGGYIRTFLDHGNLMEDMLRSIRAAGETANYRQNLLSAFNKTGQLKSESQLIEPLTRRELEVLRLLNTHLSTPEIAQELYISVNTVRSHIKNIYGKLNVNRRIAAVQRSEELGLLARKNI
jgi:LuxR family maltose regulon positive regulatory protein